MPMLFLATQAPGALVSSILALAVYVAMELDSPEDLPENLLAVLHVPILPPRSRESESPCGSNRPIMAVSASDVPSFPEHHRKFC